MDLKQLNTVALLQNEIKKLSELTIDIPYQILEAKKISTRFGNAIVFKLHEFSIYMPRRVTELLQDNLEEFKTGAYTITYKGPKSCGKPNCGLTFEIGKFHFQ